MNPSIHRPWYSIVLMLIAVCMGHPGLHAQVSLNLRASATVIAIDENITITYSLLNASSDSFLPPKFNDWMVVKGPVARTTILEENGIRTTVKEFQYMLKPLRTGSFKLPAANVVWQGKNYNSNSLLVDVLDKVEDAALARRENRPAGANEFTYDAYILEDKEDIAAKTRKNAFLKIRLSAEKVYQGQPLVAEYLLYSRVSLQAQVARRPGFNGFSSIDIMETTPGDYDLEAVGGKVYKVFPIRRVQLYPLQSGTLQLEPFSVDATVSYRKIPASGQMRDFDLYSPANIVEHKLTLESNAPEVTVTLLPGINKPDSFNGLVGRFTWTASLKKNSIKLGETGELRIVASGEGQWGLMPEPQIQWPAGLRVYEPAITEQLESQLVPIRGERQWLYRFTADSAGRFHIPSISFSSFDAVSGRYVTQSTTPFSIEVDAVPYASASAYEESTQEEVDATAVFSRYVPMAFVTAAAALLLALFIRRRRHAMQRRKEEEQWNEALAWPYETLQVAAAGKNTDMKTTLATAEHSSAVSGEWNEGPAAWKQWALQQVSSPQFRDLPDDKRLQLQQFVEQCNEWLYSPLATEADKEKLQEAYRHIRLLMA